jgi:O-methyltransferase
MRKFLRKKYNRLRDGYSSLLLSETAQAVREQALTYLRPVRLRSIERLCSRVDRRGIPGSIVEFGVALGGSGIVMASALAPGRRYFGLDVFGMIPAPNPANDGEDSIRRYAEIKSGASIGLQGNTYYGYMNDLSSKVENSFRSFPGTAKTEIVLIQGLFDVTWPIWKERIGEMALVHIDCDWHDPVAYALECCASGLARGGYIIIDDYWDYSGARMATDAFLAKRADFRPLYSRGHLVITRD